MTVQVMRKGVKVKKGQKAMDALRENVPHWIHHTKEDPSYIEGVMYLPACDCSVCGYTSNQEKKVCPKCGSKMVNW